MWRESKDKIVFQTTVKERNRVVLGNAAVELFSHTNSNL